MKKTILILFILFTNNLISQVFINDSILLKEIQELKLKIIELENIIQIERVKIIDLNDKQKSFQDSANSKILLIERM